VRASGFRGYLLDADNTLFDFDRAEREALAETLAAVCPAPPPPGVFAEYHRINAGLWKRFEQGEVDQAGLRVERFLLLFRSLGLAGDRRSCSSRPWPASPFCCPTPGESWRPWPGGPPSRC
jgi:FMN phosphatase YigB (HAD superfamily)